MTRLKIENIMFWMLILVATGIIIWKLFGSLSDMATIISIGTLIISSEIMLWKNFSKIDKNTSMSFMKVGYEVEKMKIEMNNGFDKINNRLNVIEGKMK